MHGPQFFIIFQTSETRLIDGFCTQLWPSPGSGHFWGLCWGTPEKGKTSFWYDVKENVKKHWLRVMYITFCFYFCFCFCSGLVWVFLLWFRFVIVLVFVKNRIMILVLFLEWLLVLFFVLVLSFTGVARHEAYVCPYVFLCVTKCSGMI